MKRLCADCKQFSTYSPRAVFCEFCFIKRRREQNRLGVQHYRKRHAAQIEVQAVKHRLTRGKKLTTWARTHKDAARQLAEQRHNNWALALLT